MSKVIQKELSLGGKTLTLETGKLATKANAAVIAKYGETVVLSTVVAGKAAENASFFPLAVDYEERLYAGGKISTSRFIKREGRPTEEAVLTARKIDRSIRPLFPSDYLAEVQVIITVLSVDQENDPDIVALIATSAALTASDIPWKGPISGLRIGRQNGGFIVNPTESEKKFSNLDLVLVVREDEIVMVEANADQVEEESVAAAIKFGIEESKKVNKFIEEFAKSVGNQKQDYVVTKLEPEKEKQVKEFITKKLLKELEDPKIALDEGWFGDALEELKAEFIKENEENNPAPKLLADILDEEVSDYLRNLILKSKKRIDGRSPDELRELTSDVGILPRTHGTGLFQRGDTQVLSIVTLASPALQQLIESMEGEETKRFMHHYNFPPFSVGEVRRLGSPGRREIGHGALAERALVPVIPSQEEFPYTIRIVSEVLSSAGSTSMASATGSTLALMDAGVPIKEPVAGISIGLVTEKEDKSKYLTLTDIAYQEDAQGDMDFKVAGTKNGVTAIQMDTKLDGVPAKIIEEALEKAKKARVIIIDKILSTIPVSRSAISKHAPTVIVVKIDPSKIGEVIGSGGRTINRIIGETGAAIDVDDEGTITISGEEDGARKAASWIEGIVKEAQVGEEFEGPVKRILPFGAMVEILPGKEGLVHISRLAPHRVEKVEDVVKIGQVVKVKVAEIDDQGRVNLAIAGVEKKFEAGGDRGRDGVDRGPDRRGGGGRFDRRDQRRRPKRY